MAKSSPLKNNFNGGEIGGILFGRVDATRYADSQAICKNYLPLVEGPVIRRPGNEFVAEISDSTTQARLIEFEFSTEQAYIIEAGDSYFRFFRNRGQILETAVNISGVTQADPGVVTATAHGYSNGDEVYITGVVGMTELNGRNFLVNSVTANTFELQSKDGTDLDTTGFTAYASGGTVARVYTIASPYAEADLFDLRVAQSADVLYIVHPDYAPRKISRTAHTSWTLTEIDFLDGPYLPTNTTSTTLTPSAATGSITLTASAVTGINNDTGFQSTDVGRLIRIQQGSTWGYVEITAFTSTTVVDADVINTLTNTNPKTVWRLGAWSDTDGYPSAVTFHEDRLVLSGAPGTPQRFDTSKTSDYENFAPSDTDGTVADDNALSFTLNSSKVNAIRWTESDEKGLFAGTTGQEWIISPSSQGEALTPTNINAKPSSGYGSSGVEPVRSGKHLVYVQRSGKKLRELIFSFDIDGFRSPELTQFNREILGDGVVQMAVQKEFYPFIWMVRQDGTLLSLTHDRAGDTLIAGWARHIVGGQSDAAGSQAKVESVAVIPSQDDSTEELWTIVNRRINGRTVRYVEVQSAFFTDDMDQKDAKFMDSSLTYDSPVTITGITAANPPVVTATSHGFSDGDEVLITDVLGMTEVNGNTYTVSNATANTFELQDLEDTPADIDGSGFTAYVSGGEVRKYVTTVSGAWHLEGESVSILGDGATQAAQTVANGAVTLAEKATTVQLGLNESADGKLLRLEEGAADGTALGKLRKTRRAGFLMHRSMGLKIGYSFDDLREVVFRTGNDQMDRAVPLFSGIVSEEVESDYDFENQLCWRQADPLPSTILAIMPQMKTEDRG